MLKLAQLQDRLQDQHGRRKRKLRVSLTDRCNFRCPYCMPTTPHWLPKASLLKAAEWQRLLGLFVQNGIEHLRLTGGEPLLRPDLESLIAGFQALNVRISLTTNAWGLAERAFALKAAGLSDVNISLDALDEGIFKQLSGGRPMQPVLDGLFAAEAAGLQPKLNAVLMRGVNESQILPLFELAARHGWVLRFIEYMPLDGNGAWQQSQVVNQAEVLQRLPAAQPWASSHEPAQYFDVQGVKVGFISTISQSFCQNCDRLRLTAQGELLTCLFSQSGLKLGALLREGASDTELLEAIQSAVWHKQAGYQPSQRGLAMHAVGG